MKREYWHCWLADAQVFNKEQSDWIDNIFFSLNISVCRQVQWRNKSKDARQHFHFNTDIYSLMLLNNKFGLFISNWIYKLIVLKNENLLLFSSWMGHTILLLLIRWVIVSIKNCWWIHSRDFPSIVLWMFMHNPNALSYCQISWNVAI